MNYINDGLRAKFLVDQDYDQANGVRSTLKPGYFFTNESLDFLTNFNIDNGKVLVVCSSGDHAFMCVLNGASEVDTFDSNPLQYYVMELKKAAILVLNVDEYLEYMPLRNADIRTNYNVKYYKKFRDLLNEDVRHFWDQVYSVQNPYIYLLTRFSYNIQFQSDYTRRYEELQNKLKSSPINFKLGTLFDVDTLFKDDKYSLIILSNIYDHLHLRCESYKEEDYYKFVQESIMPLLNDDGSVVFHYQFGFDKVIGHSNFNNCETYKCGLGDSVKVLRKNRSH